MSWVPRFAVSWIAIFVIPRSVELLSKPFQIMIIGSFSKPEIYWDFEGCTKFSNLIYPWPIYTFLSSPFWWRLLVTSRCFRTFKIWGLITWSRILLISTLVLIVGSPLTPWLMDSSLLNPQWFLKWRRETRGCILWFKLLPSESTPIS